MEEDIEKEGLEHLERIEQDLDEIKNRTGGRWNSLRNGIWQGAGVVVGGIVAVVLLGWVLGALGVIPGIGEWTAVFQEALEQRSR